MVACNFKSEMCDRCGRIFGPEEETDWVSIFDWESEEEGYELCCSTCRLKDKEPKEQRVKFDWAKEGF